MNQDKKPVSKSQPAKPVTASKPAAKPGSTPTKPGAPKR